MIIYRIPSSSLPDKLRRVPLQLLPACTQRSHSAKSSGMAFSIFQTQLPFFGLFWDPPPQHTTRKAALMVRCLKESKLKERKMIPGVRENYRAISRLACNSSSAYSPASLSPHLCLTWLRSQTPDLQMHEVMEPGELHWRHTALALARVTRGQPHPALPEAMPMEYSAAEPPSCSGVWCWTEGEGLERGTGQNSSRGFWERKTGGESSEPGFQCPEHPGRRVPWVSYLLDQT